MSLIEKALHRLEELKRTGVDVGDGLGPIGRASGRFVPPAEPAHVPELIARTVDVPDLRGARAETGTVPPPAPAPSTKRSRQVTIDLSRLAALEFVSPDAPRSPIANEFRVIKRPLIANVLARSGMRPKSANLIMITSALAGEGKSFCALNLALSIAMELDNTVLLVDADVARPAILPMLDLPPSPGLMDILRDSQLDLADLILRTNIEKLSILPAGTPHQRATELLASEAMNRLVYEIATRYPDRIIVFDSPPLLLTTEAPVLATHMGQIVVVVESDRTTAHTLKQAMASIEQCPVVMTMLNKARTSEMGPYYAYHYGP